MGSIDNASPVRLDLNNPAFQDGLFQLQKPERLAALDTLRKIRQLIPFLNHSCRCCLALPCACTVCGFDA